MATASKPNMKKLSSIFEAKGMDPRHSLRYGPMLHNFCNKMRIFKRLGENNRKFLF